MCTTDHVQKAFREKRGGGGGETRGDQVQARPTPLLRLLPVWKEAHQGTQLGAPSPLLNVSLHLEWDQITDSPTSGIYRGGQGLGRQAQCRGWRLDEEEEGVKGHLVERTGTPQATRGHTVIFMRPCWGGWAL